MALSAKQRVNERALSKYLLKLNFLFGDQAPSFDAILQNLKSSFVNSALTLGHN